MLQQIVERLNQWAPHQAPPVDWRVEPLLRKLPEGLATFGDVQELERMDFTAADGEYLQEAVWLRDVAAWARGSELDDLARAGRLFDWTVRNIALEPPLMSAGKPVERVPVLPWQTLLAGRGTAMDRARLKWFSRGPGGWWWRAKSTCSTRGWDCRFPRRARSRVAQRDNFSRARHDCPKSWPIPSCSSGSTPTRSIRTAFVRSSSSG